MTSSAPINKMKTSWEMSVALPFQAHFQGLFVLNLLVSRIFSSGKVEGIDPILEEGHLRQDSSVGEEAITIEDE